LHSDQIASDPTEVKNITRQYWSELYAHELPPNVPKPWLTTKSVLKIKQHVHADPFIWPRPASLSDFHTLLQKGTPRPAPGRDQWEKWIIKNLPDRALENVLCLHNYIVIHASFPGDIKDMWLTMFYNKGSKPTSQTGAGSFCPISLLTPPCLG
jgi:hypothetical protein